MLPQVVQLLLCALCAQSALAHLGHPNVEIKTPRKIPGLTRLHKAKQLESLRAAQSTESPVVAFDDKLRFVHQKQRSQSLSLHTTESSTSTSTSSSTTHPNAAPLADQYPAYNFTQPLDHFNKANNITFDMRFWISTRHYKPPSQRQPGEKAVLYVLDSGETDATGRIPYLDHGIIDILANATGGVGVILEHRYYGTSYPPRSAIQPVSEYWDTDAFRFLNNSQALEDSANFVRTAKLPGIEEPITNFTVISYGGSYPGARSAHLRVLYPELFHGAIASSAVTEAIEAFPEYFYPIARGAETNCSQAIQAAIAGFDEIAVPATQAKGNNSTAQIQALLNVFGVTGLSNVADLANVLVSPLGYFQSINWDDSISAGGAWDQFCKAMSTPVAQSPSATKLKQLGDSLELKLYDETYRLAAYMRENFIDQCMSAAPNSTTQADACFGTEDWSGYLQATQPYAAWEYQTCLNWGYFQTAPGQNGKPSGPKLISSLITLEYSTEVCRKGFPPGKVWALPKHPDVDEVNRLGGFALTKSNLAFIDGQYDPWRPATPHSEEFANGGARTDTLARPFKLIPNCWHHCDENSLPADQRDQEPARIKKIHAEEIEFVKSWLSQ